jgi:putative flippase GtrA
MSVASWIERARDHEKLRFLMVGALNTCIGYLDYAVLYWLLNSYLNYLVIGIIAHMFSVTFSFLLYRHLVFRTGRNGWTAFARYNLSVLTNLGLGLLLMFVLVSLVGLHPLLAQGITIVISIATNYLLHKFFTFAAPNPPYNGM